jgi:hypothetical protein
MRSSIMEVRPLALHKIYGNAGQEYPSTSELSRAWSFGKIQPPAIEWDGWPAEVLAAHPSLT